MRTTKLWVAALIAATATAHAAGTQPAGAPTPTTVTLPSGPGSVRGLAGDPAVSVFTGQASYAVPIELPGAARGFAPRLELAYRGDLGTGPLGIGWSLALPRIVRSTRQGVPAYQPTDELELVGVGAGGRLIAIATGEWRIEGQGNAVRVVANGAGFTAYGPDGTRYQLGVSPAARQDTGTRVAAWLVEQTIDVAGQVVDYAYDKDQGEIYPRRIAWGPQAAFAAVFERALRSDVTTSYAIGFPVTTRARITAIRVEAFGEVQRRYALGYDEGFAVSRLASVEVTGRGGADALPATRFTYAARPPGAVQLLGAGDWRLDANTILVDVDGDGAADLLRMTTTGHAYRQNRAGTFAAPVAMTGAAGITLATSRLADVEGRARANLVTAASDGWRPYRIAGASWAALGTWSGTANVPLQGDAVVLAELNGDNRVDVIEWNALGLIVRFGQATGLAPPVSKPKIGGALLPSASVRWHDVNGDGLSDALLMQSASVAVYYGRGDGTFTAPQVFAWPWGGTLATSDVRFADLDRDGLLDLVKINLGDVAWYRGKAGGGFLAQPVLLPRPSEAETSAIVAIDDANGNGSADVIWSSPSGMRALDLAGATSAGMLVGIDNGLGKTVAISYDATTALAGRDADAGTPWAWQLPIAVPVVVRTVTASGAGDPARTVDLQVRDGFWDGAENRFGGFLLGRTIVRGGALAPDRIEETRFHSGTGTTRVLRGSPVTVRVENGAGNLISLTTNTWRALRVATLPDTPLLRKAVLDRAVVEHAEGGAPVTTRVTYTRDGEGRAIAELDEGRLDRDGDESRVERSFADDAALWVRDLVAEEKRVAADGTIASWQRTYYGDHQTEQPLGGAGRGWVRRVEGLLDAGFVTRSQRDYDALGNLVRSIEGGVEHAIEYDALGLHPIREAIGALAWTSTWDLVLGVPTARTGPDGAVQRLLHDGLGRIVGEAAGARPPHKVFRYEWTAPRPRTEAFVFDRPLDEVGPVPATWTPSSGWRHTVSVTNGAGELLYNATERTPGSWLIDGWTERDAMGRPYFLGDAVEVASPTVLLAARPAGMVGQTVARDALGRPVEHTLADGTTRRFAYTAFTTTTTAAGLAPVITERDGLDRPVETRRETELARARYDAAGRATELELVAAGHSVVQQLTYDTLGRLVATSHPDGGVRTYEYDDGDRLVAETNAEGQSVANAYDAIGRLLRTTTDAATFTYHYDAPCTTDQAFTAGRLACVDEPTGTVALSYDELGRTASRTRTIDGRTGRIATEYAASGLLLAQDFDGGAYRAALGHDAAGRLTSVGDLWQLVDLDAAGRPLEERFGNRIVQRTARDVLGLPRALEIGSLYAATLERTTWGAIARVIDTDHGGLDHGATYTYDTRARLVAAKLAGGYDLSFAYDDLQNMTERTARGPTPLGVMTGEHRYGEGGRGPRQLTSIGDAASPLHTFDYDAAGRQVRVDDRKLAFDALDHLVSTDSVRHDYGFDGERVRTTQADGAVQRLFAPELVETDAGRDYLVGEGRVVARIRVAAGALAGPVRPGHAGALLVALALLAVPRRRTRRFAGLAALLALSCGPSALGELTRASTGGDVVYFHQTLGRGPSLFTDREGALVEERLHEPFGAPIEALHADGSTGAPDLRNLDRGVLGHPVDAATGWSFHGARWYQPESARWLSVDPPTRTPDVATYLATPWSLHPYQYVDQNPVLYWDPDGRDKSPIVDIRPESEESRQRSAARRPKSELERLRSRVEITRSALDSAKDELGKAFGAGKALDACDVLFHGCRRVGESAVDDMIDEAWDKAQKALKDYHDAERKLARAERRKELDDKSRERDAQRTTHHDPQPTSRQPNVPDSGPDYTPCDALAGCSRTIKAECSGGDCSLSGGTRTRDDGR